MSSPPPSNGTMIVPLPPGFTQKQFESLQGHILSITISQAVAFGVLVWDYPPDPLSGKPPQPTPSSSSVGLSQAGAVLVIASSGIIFGYRVAAIRSGNQIVRPTSHLPAASNQTPISSSSQWQPNTAPQSALQHPSAPSIKATPSCYASSVAFDTLLLLIIIIITLLKPPSTSTTQSTSGVGSLVYRDSLMYFLTTALTNITVLIIQALPSSPAFTLVKPTAVPFSTLITTTMGVRVFLNLKLFNQRQARAMQGLPLTVKSESSSSAGRVVPYTYPLPPPLPTKDVKGGGGGQSWWDGVGWWILRGRLV